MTEINQIQKGKLVIQTKIPDTSKLVKNQIIMLKFVTYKIKHQVLVAWL